MGSQPVLWYQLLAEMQEYSSQPSQHPGVLSAVKLARMLRR